MRIATVILICVLLPFSAHALPRNNSIDLKDFMVQKNAMYQNNEVCNVLDLDCGMLMYSRLYSTTDSMGPVNEPTFSRSSTAFFENENGRIVSASSGEIRFHKGTAYMSENESENLLTYSESIVGEWGAFGTTTGSSDDFGTGPDGQTSISNLVDAGSENSDFFKSISVSNSTTYTASIFVKKETSPSTYPVLRLRFSGGTPLDYRYILDTENGAMQQVSGSDAADSTEVDDIGNFYRFAITGINNASGNDTGLIAIYPASSTTYPDTMTSSVTGNVKAGFAQIEQAGYMSSYIRSDSGSTTSRAEDALSYANPFGEGLNDIVIKMTVTPDINSSDMTTEHRLFGSSDSRGINNQLRTIYAADWNFSERAAGGGVFYLKQTVFTADTRYHFVFSLRQVGSDVEAKIYLDGTEKLNTTISGFTLDHSDQSINLGYWISGSSGAFPGKISDVKIYYSLSDAGLAAVTSP